MADRTTDDGFAPMEEPPEPLGPRRRPRAQGRGRGCLIALVVAIAIALVGLYVFQYVVRRAVVEDPAEVTALAGKIFSFRLPAGFAPEGAMRLPGLGTVAAFTRDHDEGQKTLIALAELGVEMSEQEALRQLGQASGQGAEGMEMQSTPCTVAGQGAVCVDAYARADDGSRARWRAALLPLAGHTRLAAVVAPEERFDLEEAQAFLDSLTLP